MKAFNHWDIAWRKSKDEIFRLVQPPRYGWVADPFLVEYKDEIYLFAEIFLYLSERNGVIGYCKYEDDHFGEWTVTMDRHWHLSYPNVFVKDNHLYMVPESYQLGEVALYELIAFPDKWRKVHSYITDVEYCDSTFLHYDNGKEYMFTFERGEESPHGRSFLYEVFHEGLRKKKLLSDNLEGARCGGKIIHENNTYIRVAQDCSKEYGGSLIFYEIDSVEPTYIEHEIKRIEPEDIIGEFERKYIGIHTYNRMGSFEVIDLKYTSSSYEETEASERVRRVFNNKYS